MLLQEEIAISFSYLKKFGFHKGLLSKNEDRTLYQIEKFDDVKTSSKPSHEAIKQKGEEVDIRQPGSGRSFIAEKYPQLSSCMLMLFDSCGSGLQSYPRLICETLFMDKKTLARHAKSIFNT